MILETITLTDVWVMILSLVLVLNLILLIRLIRSVKTNRALIEANKKNIAENRNKIQAIIGNK